MNEKYLIYEKIFCLTYYKIKYYILNERFFINSLNLIIFHFSKNLNIFLLNRKGSKVIFLPGIWFVKMREEIRNQTAHLELNSWKELHTFLKNSRVRYRVSLDEAKSLHQVFSRKFYSQRSRDVCNIILCNGFIKV